MTPADAHQIAAAFEGVYKGVCAMGMPINGCIYTVPATTGVCDVAEVPANARVWKTEIDDPEMTSHRLMLLCRDIARHAVHSRGLMFYRQKPNGEALTADADAGMLPCRVELFGPRREKARVTVVTR